MESQVMVNNFEDFTLDPRWCVVDRNVDTTRCILMLAGRSQGASVLPSVYWYGGLQDTLIVGIQTKAQAWYPLPKGERDQYAAVKGIPHAVDLIEVAVRQIRHHWEIPKHRIVLLGYSAGGVMAIQTAVHSKYPYAGVVCQSGAILTPESLPFCPCPETPFLLTHSRNDETFEWNERYVPMKRAFAQQKYRLTVSENPYGGHSLTDVDIALAKIFMRKCFRDSPK